MPHPELAHLELLAEVDSLVERLRRWADGAPAWQPAEACRAVVARLVDRTRALRVRLEAPLVVATLGGTGTGKSAWSTPWSGPKWSARDASARPRPGRR